VEQLGALTRAENLQVDKARVLSDLLSDAFALLGASRHHRLELQFKAKVFILLVLAVVKTDLQVFHPRELDLEDVIDVGGV